MQQFCVQSAVQRWALIKFHHHGFTCKYLLEVETMTKVCVHPQGKTGIKLLKFCWHFRNDVLCSVCKICNSREVYINRWVMDGWAATSTACLVPYSNKCFTMELDSKERKQRNWNTFLTVFVSVTFTLALLEGAGLIVSYAYIQNSNNRIAVLESRVLGVRSRVMTLEVPSTDGSPGKSLP